MTEHHTTVTACPGRCRPGPRLRHRYLQANVDNNKAKYEEEQKEKVRQCEQARDRRYPLPMMLLPA